jgi:hypothetical protein
MLQQDRVNLHADAKATSAALLDRELSHIASDMNTLASISAFIGGFLYRYEYLLKLSIAKSTAFC